MTALFLASGSPRRRDLLEHHRIPFTVIPNLYNEDDFVFDTHRLKWSLRRLAWHKAHASQAHYKGLILGVDTIVALGNTLFGKPKTLDHAAETLAQLSGNTHQVMTGFCVLDSRTQRYISRTCTTQITFHHLSADQIHDYCRNYSVLDKAGAYAIQDIGHHFVSRIQGSWENVVGLPVTQLRPFLV